MTNSKQQLADLYAKQGGTIERIGQTELFIVHTPLTQHLYSYTTRVGIYKHGKWYLTLERHSVTTTRQVNQLAISVPRSEWVTGETLDQLAKEGAACGA